MNYPKSYISEAQQIIDDRKNRNDHMLDLRYEEIKSKGIHTVYYNYHFDLILMIKQ
jgi:hypothetical protein